MEISSNRDSVVSLFNIICPLHTNSGCGKERRIIIGP